MGSLPNFKKSNSNWILVFFIVFISCAPDYNVGRTWSVYKADSESTSYSPLHQINTKNVGQLRVAWKFHPDDAPKGSYFGRSECNPIVIDGVMYITSARHRVYAINADNGDKVWSFDPFNGERGGGVSRGVTYWEDANDKRILFTAGDQLFALDAQTGKPITSFGNEGKVSMNYGLRGDPKSISVIPTSPGIVYNDLLIMGAEVSELYGAEPGYIRAYNIRTGKLVWTFHTIPWPGEVGYDTWPKDAWKYTGGANDWGGMSLDKERGMVFLALGSPTYDYYGADRKGENLFGNCVVALQAKTGQYIWHYQTVHHDLWDYDLPAPPNLVTLMKDGKKLDAVAQTSKTGFLYVLNRETGEPLFPVVERSVPASHIPGEEAWPSQPFPLKPAPYARQLLSEEDLSNYSKASYDSLLKKFTSLRYEGMFTPPDTRGTLMFPGSRGGSSWGGGAFDPSSGIIYVKSNDSPEISLLRKFEPQDNTADKSLYAQGKSLYTNYCVSCHGTDRNGQEPDYPSLVGLDLRMSKADVLNKIKVGGGKMPAFASVLEGKKDAIIVYLFQQENIEQNIEKSFLREIQNNESANKMAKSDSLARYLNVTAYGYFRDSEGRPGIKPPWGTLSAINLNTGDYVWKVTAGNIPELQEEKSQLTGTEGSVGPIVTSGGLVFLGGTEDNKMRAFDKETGKLLWETTLPAIGTSSPSTYMSNGKQYIAISVAGNKKEPAGYIVAYSLQNQ